MSSRVTRNHAGMSFTSFVVELFVVILGILIAFQVDRWDEERRERQQEYGYLVRLKEDLRFEIERMDEAHGHAQSRIDAATLLELVAEDPSFAEERPGELAWALETVSWRSFPQIDAFVYSELQNSGNLALIRSVSLRRDLAGHYTSIRHYSRVGLDLDLQHQFDRLTAGMLTTSELRAIEDGSWQETSFEISPARADEIAIELARRQEALDLLPSIVQHHVFNQKVIAMARDQALQIIGQIDSLVENFDHWPGLR